VVALGNAKPSPYLPRVYWRHDAASHDWLTPANWSADAYPGEGIDATLYPDVSALSLADDSAYCYYTIVDSAAYHPVVSVVPPEVQALVDREDAIETYEVDEDESSALSILKGIYPALFRVTLDNVEGRIIVEEGSMEVFQD